MHGDTVDQLAREKFEGVVAQQFCDISAEALLYGSDGAQNRRLLTRSPSDFRSVAYAVLTAAAMVHWLDDHSNIDEVSRS
jgi:hypothetical protein